MSIRTHEKRTIQLEGAPSVAGLSYRGFRGEEDFSQMLAVLQASKIADQVERGDTLQDIVNTYTHLVNCDPFQDMIFAQVDGIVIGYNRVFWRKETEGATIYQHFGFLAPAWRRRGIGRAMLHGAERRLTEIASDHHCNGARFFESFAEAKEYGTQALLTQEGYQAIRREYTMVRPNLEEIPPASLPPGIEIRPVLEEHLSAIRSASVEAFRDHWSFSEELEPTVDQWKSSPSFDPSLWKVAWEGDQVVGMVLSFINHKENEEYARKRGWTENICVRRGWRKRGIAQALIAESLKELKRRDMQEAALGVDAENLSGALRLYERLGYRAVHWTSFYRKPLTLTETR